MKITTETDLKSTIEKWAQENNHDIKFVERGTEPSFGVETEEWGIEVLPQDGWAYLNGYKALSDFSTNIDDTDDIEHTFEKLIENVN